MNPLTALISDKIGKFDKKHNCIYTDPNEKDNYNSKTYEVGRSDATEYSNTLLQEFDVLIHNVEANKEVFQDWFETLVVDRVALMVLVSHVQVVNSVLKQERNENIGKVNGYLYVLEKLNDTEIRL